MSARAGASRKDVGRTCGKLTDIYFSQLRLFGCYICNRVLRGFYLTGFFTGNLFHLFALPFRSWVNWLFFRWRYITELYWSTLRSASVEAKDMVYIFRFYGNIGFNL